MGFSIFRRKPVPPQKFAARRASAAKSPGTIDGELDAFTEAGGRGRGLRLEVGASGLDPCIEQVAILFAADHQSEARMVLETALEQGDAPEACWLMLLELYELQGDRQRYQDVALEYAVRFRKSPPTPRKDVATAAGPQGGRRLCGQIVSAGSDSFAFLLASSGGTEVEIDASQLQRMDFVSAGILLNTMLALQKAGKRVRIRQLSHLVAALLTSVGIGAIAALETKRN